MVLCKPKAIPETDLSREGEMSTVHRTELNRRSSVVVGHSFVQSGTREPILRATGLVKSLASNNGQKVRILI